MTLTVIDVGCATYGGDESVNYLIETFTPDVLIGYDPNLPQEFIEYRADSILKETDTQVRLFRAAAWLYNGEAEFVTAGLGSHIGMRGQLVPCIDLCELIASLEGRIILKIDAEGAEYDLLRAIVREDLDEKLELAWIEWHCKTCGHGVWSHAEKCPDDCKTEEQSITPLEQALRCETKRWNH